MQNLISDLIKLEALTKEVHWNMRGRGFIFVHKYLDEVYESCEEYIDEVAEHMAARGEKPCWTPAVYEHFPKSSSASSVHVALKIMTGILTEVVTNAEEACLSADGSDPAGEDILVRVLQDFNKHRWFFVRECGGV